MEELKENEKGKLPSFDRTQRKFLGESAMKIISQNRNMILEMLKSAEGKDWFAYAVDEINSLKQQINTGIEEGVSYKQTIITQIVALRKRIEADVKRKTNTIVN